MAKKRRRRDCASRVEARSTSTDAAGPEDHDAAQQDWRLPSPTARVLGGLLAIVTVILAVLVLVNAFSSDHAAIDTAARVGAAFALWALAIFIAALAVVPGYVRKFIVRD